MPIEGDGEEWSRDVEDPGVRRTATAAVARGKRRPSPSGAAAAAPDPEAIVAGVRAELERAAGRGQAGRFEDRLDDAARHFEAERYGDAAKVLKKLAASVPTVAAVRELYGLTLYRQGQWADAVVELEAFRLLTGSVEQHPVLADCYRALGHPTQVEELWEELRHGAADPAVVVEGRIVVAGMRADDGDVAGGIRLLTAGWKLPRRPRPYHLRRAYALADLYERAGEVVHARQLFDWVADADPELADARRRARSLA